MARFYSLNEILASAANIGLSQKEIAELKNNIKNDTTGQIRTQFLQQLQDFENARPKPFERAIRWKPASETEDSKKERKGR